LEKRKIPCPMPGIESWFHGCPVRGLVRIRYPSFKLCMESSDDTSLNLIQDILCVLTIENMMTGQNWNILPSKTNVATVRSRESRKQKHMKDRNRKFNISRNHIFLYTSFLSFFFFLSSFCVYVHHPHSLQVKTVHIHGSRLTDNVT
jgi:hypothetical protein